MFSIFHFFADIAANKRRFLEQTKLDDFPFPKEMFSCYQNWAFPDAAIRVNQSNDTNPFLSGGELLEFKDAKSFNIPSFNSTIPTGTKKISELGNLTQIMESNGDTPHVLPVRQVYYLLRGRNDVSTKVCLVHGSFFETIKTRKLIKESFAQVLADAMGNGNDLTKEEYTKFAEIFARQNLFAASRKVDKASVSMRFRVMTEVRKEANIFNEKYYPAITADTLNLIVPVHGRTKKLRAEQENLINMAMGTTKIRGKTKEPFLIKHPFNGYFLVSQLSLV